MLHALLFLPHVLPHGRFAVWGFKLAAPCPSISSRAAAMLQGILTSVVAWIELCLAHSQLDCCYSGSLHCACDLGTLSSPSMRQGRCGAMQSDTCGKSRPFNTCLDCEVLSRGAKAVRVVGSAGLSVGCLHVHCFATLFLPTECLLALSVRACGSGLPSGNCFSGGGASWCILMPSSGVTYQGLHCVAY